MSRRSEAIAAAASTVFSQNVDGWVGNRIADMVRFCDSFHEQAEIRGDIAEIGIHHGKLFFILAAAARSDERCIAVDVFNNQSLNVDQSGNGDLGQFSAYIDTLFPKIRPQLNIIQGDSMSIPPSAAGKILGSERVRLFSIDGGHTRHHVRNDMCIAQQVLVSGGVVLLDDFLGPLWPGVTEGFFEYMKSLNRRLAPFMIFENKLFLTTFSEHATVLAAVHEFIEREHGDEIHHRWRYGELCGFKVLGCSRG